MTSHEVRRLLPQDLKPYQTLSDYLAVGGGEGIKKARTLSPAEIIETVKQANLRGRGGAGFPTGVKWGSVRSESCPIKYVACNAAEGEPGTFKDRYLLLRNPYSLLEGIMIACFAVGAVEAYIGIKKRFVPQVRRLFAARREMEQAGIIDKGRIKIALGPDDYLFGEEKGLLEVIDGRDPMPRNIPPYIQGINFQPGSPNPTSVNNAETFSHVPSIIARGAAWFKSVGSEDTPGTMLYTISGDVKRPGVYELPCGLALGTILNEVAGGPVGQHSFKAVFSGVASGVVTPERFNTPADFGSLRKAGGGLGSAGFIVYDASACMVQVALTYANFLARSSCGQCVPCNKGTARITEILYRIESGAGSEDDLRAIIDETGKVTNQTRCFLPTQASVLIPSILKYFPEEFKKHLGRAPQKERDLILPKLNDYDEAAGNFTYDDPKKFPLAEFVTW